MTSTTRICRFLGYETPLSPFRLGQIEIDGIKYGSVMHYLATQRSKLFNDEETAEKIQNTLSALAVNSLPVKGFDEQIWKNMVPKFLMEALRAKVTFYSHISIFNSAFTIS